MYAYISICTYACGGYVYYVYVCVGYQRVCMIACLSDTDPLARSEPDLDLCSPWTLRTGDFKTDPWDDPEIHTGSCSEDPTTI